MLTIKQFEKKTGICITTNHTGKMEGLASISTSPLSNPFCEARAKNPAFVCSHCYSVTMQRRFSNLNKKLEKNGELLTAEIIPIQDLPFIPYRFFRFEAFGDLINEMQVVNYFNIARVNPAVQCALWTKNPAIIERAINQYGLKKPKNIKIIASSAFLNKITDFSKYSFIDNVFTVYSAGYIEKNNIDITCGARSCLFCDKCYTGGHKSKFVSEKLK